MKLLVPRTQYQRCICLILFLGIFICCWELGSTGLVDETPPLFAAASRAMSNTGDWLTPRVNGLPRFDKPPLVYWLMGFFYGLPGQDLWDPLGTWAARLPSALSTLAMMLVLGDTVIKWPGKDIGSPARAAVVTSLAFALSPLVLIWSRIAVSDALLCSTLGISLILNWRTYVNPIKKHWPWQWTFLGLAVLTKGPVAIVLTIMILTCFSIFQSDYINLIKRIKPIRGIFITFLISSPWYFMELLVEGKPFWDSFFGYHNFQRLTSVVNSHSQPWWFFFLILVVSSLPFTPFLILGLIQSISSFWNKNTSRLKKADQSLLNFSASWLVSVFLLFTLAATKLPSYWIPATPAAAILIGLSSHKKNANSPYYIAAIWASIALSLSISLVLWASKLWIFSVNDPEIPNFSYEFISSGIYIKGALMLTITSLLGVLIALLHLPKNFFLMQVPLILFQLLFMLPMWNISDRLRQLPLRKAADLLASSQREHESLAMVGINKPSIHFYTKKIILYEANDAEGLVNLADRLNFEVRQGWQGKPLGVKNSSQTVLLIIDNKTSSNPHWKGLNPEILGKYSIYNIWRLDREELEDRARHLIKAQGWSPDWNDPRPERM